MNILVAASGSLMPCFTGTVTHPTVLIWSVCNADGGLNEIRLKEAAQEEMLRSWGSSDRVCKCVSEPSLASRAVNVSWLSLYLFISSAFCLRSSRMRMTSWSRRPSVRAMTKIWRSVSPEMVSQLREFCLHSTRVSRTKCSLENKKVESPSTTAPRPPALCGRQASLCAALIGPGVWNPPSQFSSSSWRSRQSAAPRSITLSGIWRVHADLPARYFNEAWQFWIGGGGHVARWPRLCGSSDVKGRVVDSNGSIRSALYLKSCREPNPRSGNSMFTSIQFIFYSPRSQITNSPQRVLQSGHRRHPWPLTFHIGSGWTPKK